MDQQSPLGCEETGDPASGVTAYEQVSGIVDGAYVYEPVHLDEPFVRSITDGAQRKWDDDLPSRDMACVNQLKSRADALQWIAAGQSTTTLVTSTGSIYHIAVGGNASVGANEDRTSSSLAATLADEERERKLYAERNKYRSPDRGSTWKY